MIWAISACRRPALSSAGIPARGSHHSLRLSTFGITSSAKCCIAAGDSSRSWRWKFSQSLPNSDLRQIPDIVDDGSPGQQMALAVELGLRLSLVVEIRPQGETDFRRIPALFFRRPQDPAGSDDLVADPSAGGEGRGLDGLEFLLHPSGADPEAEATAAQSIDGGDR